MKTIMKRLGLTIIILGMGLLPSTQMASLTQTAVNMNNGTELDPSKARIQVAYGNLPLYFIQNDGQVDKRVKFYEKGSGHATYFTKDGISLSLAAPSDKAPNRALMTNGTKDGVDGLSPRSGVSNRQATVVRLVPLEANENPKIVAEGLQEGKVNYLIGNDPKKWKTNIPTYQAVSYKEIYPGIDMKFYGSNHQLEYDIIVQPGADPSKVRLAYEGIEGLDLAKEGDLVINLKGGKIIQKKPSVYQEINGKRVNVKGIFKITETGPITENSKQFAYSFQVASYDPNYPLIIDPTLVYSTYLGGNSEDFGRGIAVDGSGNAYVVGYTLSSNFPTANALQPANGGNSDAFVAKLNATGSALLYSTYLGGNDGEVGFDIKVDDFGNAYVTGQTSSINFPTANALQPTFGGGYSDAFVAKLNASGSSLLYSTYLGGNDFDFGSGIAVDDAGNAYMTGRTSSINFPTANALQPTFGGGNSDAFVAKLNATGSALLYSTYLGGSFDDGGSGIAVDVSGNAYVIGTTFSSNFPMTGPLQPTFGGGNSDAFVAKLNATGSALLYSTYLGGSGDDSGSGIAVDASGNYYMTGGTTSTNFPTANALQPVNGSGGSLGFLYDAFITKLNATGSVLLYSTYLGGGFDDGGSGIAVDVSGNAYVIGTTFSSNFPTANALQPVNAGIDAFVAKINANGSSLLYSTYLGGGFNDGGVGIAVDASGNVYVTGDTSSLNFPTASFLQSTLSGPNDAFVVKIADATPTELVNISTRAPVLTADNVAIGGFIIGGSEPMTVLIRARGPSMGGAPFNVPGTLSNPMVQLYSGQTIIAQNDNWQTTNPQCDSPAISCGNAAQITSTGKDPCQSFPGQSSPPQGCTLESAILVTLPPGRYTAIISGVGGTTGVGLVEVFDVDGISTAKLINISTRAHIETGDNVGIGGFRIGGSDSKTVLIRARGPSLSAFGVSGTLANPTIQLYSGQTVIAQNDDWQTTDPLCGSPAVSCGNATDIQNTGLDPCSVTSTSCTLDSAILVTLPPGLYTAILRGVNNGTGVGIVEVFDLSQ